MKKILLTIALMATTINTLGMQSDPEISRILNSKNPYKILGIETSTGDKKIIRRAYQKLLGKYRSNRTQEGQKALKKIIQAYEALAQPTRPTQSRRLAPVQPKRPTQPISTPDDRKTAVIFAEEYFRGSPGLLKADLERYTIYHLKANPDAQREFSSKAICRFAYLKEPKKIQNIRIAIRKPKGRVLEQIYTPATLSFIPGGKILLARINKLLDKEVGPRHRIPKRSSAHRRAQKQLEKQRIEQQIRMIVKHFAEKPVRLKKGLGPVYSLELITPTKSRYKCRVYYGERGEIGQISLGITGKKTKPFTSAELLLIPGGKALLEKIKILLAKKLAQSN